MKRWALLFDLDGTLVDSVPDLAAAANAMLEERGFLPLGEGEVKRMVGDGVAALVERALAARGAPFSEEALATFVVHYEAAPAVRSAPYPAVPETLARLAAGGARLALCTNKPDRATELVLGDLGLARWFEVIVGGDTAPRRKPDGRHLLAALARLGAMPDEAVMIGDNENDAAAAHEAGLPLVLMRYGYARRPIEELGADVILDRFADLPDAVARL